MSDTTVPTSSIVTAPDRNPLGRVALGVALVQLAVGCAMTIIQPLVGVRATSMEEFQSMVWVTNTGQLINIGLAVLATILGIIAWRRRNLPRTGACLAVGISGSSIIGYIFALISGLILSMVQMSNAPVPIPG